MAVTGLGNHPLRSPWLDSSFRTSGRIDLLYRDIRWAEDDDAGKLLWSNWFWDVSVEEKEGLAASEHVALGGSASTIPKANTTTAVMEPFGASAITYVEKNIAISVHDAESIGSLESSNTNIAISEHVGAGTSANETPRSGVAISNFTGSGVKQSGAKRGDAILTLVASGGSQREMVRSGTAEMSAVAIGSFVRELPLAGSAALIAEVSGTYITELPRAGISVMSLTGFGDRGAMSFSREGVGVLVGVGRGRTTHPPLVDEWSVSGGTSIATPTVATTE